MFCFVYLYYHVKLLTHDVKLLIHHLTNTCLVGNCIETNSQYVPFMYLCVIFTWIAELKYSGAFPVSLLKTSALHQLWRQ